MTKEFLAGFNSPALRTDSHFNFLFSWPSLNCAHFCAAQPTENPINSLKISVLFKILHVMLKEFNHALERLVKYLGIHGVKK